jgi:signal transduction histidine kinase
MYGVLGFAGRVRSVLFPWDLIELSLVTGWCGWLRLRGHTAFAATLLLVVLSHPIAFISAQYGPTSPAPALFIPTIALAGLIVGRRLVWPWAAICSAVIIFVDARPVGISNPWGSLATWVGLYAATAWLVALLAQRLEALLTLARDQEEAARAAVLSERSRMARDLHDSLAQGFTGVVIQLRAAEEAMTASPPDAPGHLARAREAAEAGLVAAKESVWALREFLPDKLETSLRSLANDRFAETSTTVNVDVQGVTQLGEAETNVALAVAGEAITNILRHAEASTVRIELTTTRRETVLEISDDGVGISDTPGHGDGLGLPGMLARATEVGGALVILPNTPTGTTVRLTLPAKGRRG